MAKIKLYTYNVLDQSGSAITVTGSPDSGYPEERLYDRSIDFYWKYTASATITFHVDQGAGGSLLVDTLIINRHNFTGRSMSWQYSDNDSDWSDLVTGWTQGDNNQIVKVSTEASAHRYLRLVVTSAVNPQCTEVFMSSGYEFQVRFDEPPEELDVDNVLWEETLGGCERSTKLGDVRKGRMYSVFLNPTLLASWRTAISYLDENSKPFYVKDHEDNYWLGRFKGLPGGVFPVEQNQTKQFELLEIL
jgi:hypothetical protein